ncbi:hypothetical protein V6N12_010018 [Hibiscus sabdariffa]|uniref:Uncharacterized protein n=1 Tax=Hibiscus sabdariffa TaxID=183260 RepID=A0ABR2ECF2_9ROSI
MQLNELSCKEDIPLRSVCEVDETNFTPRDALSNSDDPAEISAQAGPAASAEASPLLSYQGRLSKQKHRRSRSNNN